MQLFLIYLFLFFIFVFLDLKSTIGSIEDDVSMMSIDRVIAAVENVKPPIISYTYLKEELMRNGLSLDLANWLSTSVKRTSRSEYQFKFNTSIIKQLLKSYRDADYWDVVGCPPPNKHIHLVRAEFNNLWTEDVVERLELIASAIPDQFSTCVVKNAGHWLQVDNPDGLYDAIRTYL